MTDDEKELKRAKRERAKREWRPRIRSRYFSRLDSNGVKKLKRARRECASYFEYKKRYGTYIDSRPYWWRKTI